MTHGSLFSGVGGFDLAADWMGWENVFHCDNKKYCQERLSYHFPQSKSYGDIRTINGNEWNGKVDVLTGGFPCQPFSVAGDRRGTDDARFLWPEMLRVIREIQPSWVIAENVRGITSQGGEWCLNECSLTWKIMATKSRHSVFQLVPSGRPTAGIGYGLLPTIGANESKGAGRKRYRGSPEFRGAKMSEGLRSCESDPIYTHPHFAEAVMGFPKDWTLAETPLCPKLPI